MTETLPLYTWNIPDAALAKENSLAERLVEDRGLTPEELNPRSVALHDPMLMQDMDVAVERLKRAINKKEKIVVYGDYDVDGICSTAVMVSGLMKAGANLSWILPDRHLDGYGIRPDGVARAYKEHSPAVLITVDNGITQFEAVEAANALGMDVIVTDHHHPRAKKLPAALATVNPNRHDCQYPFKGLTGAGVAFKVVQRLMVECLHDEFERKRFVASLLDLVALGTVADVATVRDENRILVRRGLRRMSVDPRPGMLALLQAAQVERKPVTTSTLGFQIGPRINAAGRLSKPDDALRLLLTQDHGEAMNLAAILNRLNQERKELVRRALDEARSQAMLQVANESILIVSDPAWHLGIIGLISGKLTEEFGKPSLVATEVRGDGISVASLRSVDGYNIVEAVDACGELLMEYGGHPGAAGLSVKSERFDKLREMMADHARKHITSATTTESLTIDAVLQPHDMGIRSIEEMNSRLAPYGEGNREPVVLLAGAKIVAIQTLSSGEHLKLKLNVAGMTIDALWWRKGEMKDVLGPNMVLDVAGRLEINEFRGDKFPQIIVDDVKPA